MPTAYISIGSNIDRDHHIPTSLAELATTYGPLTCSSIYEAAAVGFAGDAFYNLVVGFNTELPAKTIAHSLRDIELAHGRTRNSQKFSARTLDLDLILYGDLILSEDCLQIPREEIERYAFVLEPLAEIAPDLVHPIKHLTYTALWQAFDKSQLQQKRINPAWLHAKASAI